MRPDLKFKVFLLICGLFLFSTVAFAQTDAAKTSEITFPDVEGWEKGEVTTYPSSELGYSVTYKSEEGGTVTFYVYNGGMKKIADGVTDKKVMGQLKNAENEIIKTGEAGYYDDVKMVKSETVTMGGKDGKIKALYSLLSFKIRGTAVDSEIYIFGYKNNFIKVRTTRRKGENGPENATVNNLLMEVGKIFAE